jgi:predicted ATPase
VRRDLPTGTVTFLFTDVEGSTKLLKEIGDEAYDGALAAHRRVVRDACAENGGVEVDTQGDAFFFAFSTAPAALRAASAMKDGLASGPIRVRIGLHTGEPRVSDEGYVGKEVHLAARVAATGHGGQIVLSRAAAELVEADLTDLGEHRLKDIAEAVPIYQLGNESFPPLKTISNTNLPRPASSFVGRETEVSQVLTEIRGGARLLTLTGPGGSGKTRLALETATTLVPEYKAGVFWVGLAALRDPSLVTEQIAQTLGAKDGLAAHIGERELCLLLDNVEQVIDAAPELSQLLRSCPNLTLLCTSRELLRIEGEVDYPVPPLASQEAVSLFCERSGLDPTDEIAELCARLDNLPLAVELAAARTRALTTAQILERLSSRLDLLKGGRDADPRQQTLRATIAWSYDLLSEEEQRLFRSLSVFWGGCTLEAAEEVCDADLDILQSLVEKSLVRFSNSRYWMLETIREYAGERLEGSEEWNARRSSHGEYYVRWAEDAAPKLRGPTQAEWLGRVDVEYDNLRTVLASDIENQSQRAMRVGAALRRYWWARASSEGRIWLDRLLPIARSSPLDEASFWVIAGAGALNREQGDWELGIALAEEALSLAQTLGDPALLAGTEHELALALDLMGDSDRARVLYGSALQRRRELGDLVGVVQDLNGLAAIALDRGELAEARALLVEALELARQLDDRESIAGTLAGLAEIALEDDRDEIDLPWVIEALRESLRLARELGNPAWICGFLELFARADYLRGRTASAVRLLGTAAATREDIGVPLAPIELTRYGRTVEMLRDSLGEESFETLWNEGRSARLDDVLDDLVERAIGRT